MGCGYSVYKYFLYNIGPVEILSMKYVILITILAILITHRGMQYLDNKRDQKDQTNTVKIKAKNQKQILFLDQALNDGMVKASAADILDNDELSRVILKSMIDSKPIIRLNPGWQLVLPSKLADKKDSGLSDLVTVLSRDIKLSHQKIIWVNVSTVQLYPTRFRRMGGSGNQYSLKKFDSNDTLSTLLEHIYSEDLTPSWKSLQIVTWVLMDNTSFDYIKKKTYGTMNSGGFSITRMSGVLWLARDIAPIDEARELLEGIGVETSGLKLFSESETFLQDAIKRYNNRNKELQALYDIAYFYKWSEAETILKSVFLKHPQKEKKGIIFRKVAFEYLAKIKTQNMYNFLIEQERKEQDQKFKIKYKRMLKDLKKALE